MCVKNKVELGTCTGSAVYTAQTACRLTTADNGLNAVGTVPASIMSASSGVTSPQV